MWSGTPARVAFCLKLNFEIKILVGHPSGELDTEGTLR